MATALLLVGLAAALAAEPARPAWGVRAHASPPALAPGGRARVRVELVNLSRETWSEDQKDRLAYHWRAADGSVVQWDGERTRLPGPVEPGRSVVLDARVAAPPVPGRFTLEWALVRENAFWYPAPAVGDARAAVDIGPGPRAWTIDVRDLPGSLPARGRAQARALLCNAGASTWSAAHGDALSYRWYDAEGRASEGVRTPLAAAIEPGGCAELRAELRAPERPGPHLLVWEPVREGQAWYGPPASGERERWLAVGPARDAFAVLSAELPPLRAGLPAEAWVVLENRSEETWLPGQGLKVSYQWRDAAGAPLPLEGRRSELPARVEPGEVAALAVRVAPPGAGERELAWRMVREGEAWISPEPDIAEPVRVGPPALAWALEAVDWPGRLHASEAGAVRVTVRNDGAETWSPGQGDRLSYHWRTPGGAPLEHEGLRTELPGPVAPGESVSLEVRVAGPARAGDYRLELGMVREQVAWYPAPAGLPSGQVIGVAWRSARWQLALLLLTFAALALARLRRPPARSWRWAALSLAPALWLWAAGVALEWTFAELAAAPFWQGGRLVAASSAAIPALLVLLVPAALRAPLAFLLSAGTAVLLLADLLYMHVLGAIVPVQALVGAHQVGDIGASVRALLEPGHAWLLPAPLAGLALALLWPSARGEDRPPARTRRRATLAGLLALALAGAPAALALREAMVAGLGARVFSEQHNAGRFGVLGAHLFDVVRTLREALGRGALDPAQRAEIARRFADRPPPPPSGFGLARGANLLAIQAEALQGWVIDARVRGQEVTPFLNRLRRRALYFSAVADVTAQGMTSDAEYAVLNSQYPLGQGAVAFLRAGNGFVTAAHALREAGYATLSAHPYKRGFWNRAALHPRYGFQRSLFDRELGPGPTVGWGLADGEFFARMVPVLAETPAPWFALLISLSLHHPYDEFPDALKRMELGELEGTSLGNYLHGMRYLDESLARLFAELDAAGLGERTAVAIYGDHDCRLGVTPEIAALAGEPAGSPSLPLRLERIPAFLVLPKGQATGEVAAVGSHVDLAPTWLHYLGVPAPRAFIGRPLLPGAPEEHRFAAFADGSAIAEGVIYAASGREVPPEGACFDRLTGARIERSACAGLAARARATLEASRAVADHDLARELAGPPYAPPHAPP